MVIKGRSETYIPYEYWNQVVHAGADISAVGHPALGAYNRIAYRLRLAAFKRATEGLLKPSTRVFDAGFGVGFYLKYYAMLGIESVAGVDLSESAVRDAIERFPRYHLFQHDISDPVPLPADFDLVTAIDVLYHIVDDSRWASALTNLSNLLVARGTLIFTDKFPEKGTFQAFSHVRRRPLEMYQKVLHDQGLKVVAVYPVFVFMDDPILSGTPRWLAYVSFLQWRVVQKVIRTLGSYARLRDAIGICIGGIQYPFEKSALSLLRRVPNLEIVVARKNE